MPKKRRAFWLANLDEDRIFQRPYFKAFDLPDVTDAEILSMLKVSDSDSLEEMERKLAQVKSLHEKAQDFQELASRYSDRLKKVHGKTYADFLSLVMSLADLLSALRQLYYENEKRIQKEYQKIFIERLKKYRKAAGLTQKELGELVQVSPMGMSHYARGERDIPTHTLIRIAKILNVSTDELLGLR